MLYLSILKRVYSILIRTFQIFCSSEFEQCCFIAFTKTIFTCGYWIFFCQLHTYGAHKIYNGISALTPEKCILYHISSHRILLHYIVLYCLVSHPSLTNCITSYHITAYRIIIHHIPHISSYCIVLYCP